MYLLIRQELTRSQARWLDNNCIKVGTSAWVHNTLIPGTTAITLTDKQKHELSIAIEDSASRFIEKLEDRIMRGSLVGRSFSLAVNKLRLIADVSVSLDTIGYAMDLLNILGQEECGSGYEPETVVNSHTSLGIDVDTAKNYILGLAKRKTIH